MTNNETLYPIIRTFVRAVQVQYRKPAGVTRDNIIFLAELGETLFSKIENDQTSTAMDVADALQSVCESLRSEVVNDIKDSCNDLLRELEAHHFD